MNCCLRHHLTPMQKMCLNNLKCRNSPLWLLLLCPISCSQPVLATDHRGKTTVSLYFLKICKFLQMPDPELWTFNLPVNSKIFTLLAFHNKRTRSFQMPKNWVSLRDAYDTYFCVNIEKIRTGIKSLCL